MTESMNFLDAIMDGNEEAMHYATYLYEQAERHRWHDLRKDPDDLPKENGQYLIVYQWIGNNTGITVETYTHYDGFHTPPEYPCIAWKEIEPFEVSK